ncbi:MULTISPECIES: hypothetical protein [unclassified Flavobacterium]|uniref:hypothetical protein n=1 Tax=unclassified Flavobacterium TaxID=196869 RepID=UPI00057E5B85|nr:MULTISPECIES: hypothetical protein [unclassified Flavobacterium]KIC00427.1 hypothetical protein OA93_02205 [Flavobacterium sp. KMS]KIC01524.1 hypothetical protein OA88_13530 [Flavobacterium sp. JRM]MEA9411554.1 hypothetical protein [Flavobacterium sp. PL02]
MKKIFFTIFILIQSVIYSQSVDLRNLTMNSDLILFVEYSDFEYGNRYINDHYKVGYIKVNNYEEIIKNDSNIKFIDKEIFCPQSENDYYESSMMNGETCMGIAEGVDSNRKYYGILFFKKEKKKLTLLVHLSKSDSDWKNIIEKIKKVKEIENSKSPEERYEKSIDYYLKCNDLPKYDFINYYRQVKVLKSDTLVLTEKQLILAKDNFLGGNESYYKLISEKFPEEVKQFYINKMKEILSKNEEEYFSSYDFNEAYERATNTDYMDDSVMGKLKEKLSNEITLKERIEIMQDLIQNAEQED